jgi:hypothetical protein
LIEDAWGQAKGYADGRSAKGRPALTPDFDYEGTYTGLWRQWAEANPELMDELAAKSQGQVLVDRFAKTENNQARALAQLLSERPAPEQSAATGPLRMIVAGGRNFSDYERLKASIAEALGDHPLDQLRIVSGGARGADLLGERWAKEHGVPIDRYDARWDDLDAPGAVIGVNARGQKYNRAAGFARNAEMAANADAVLAMPGGKGTADMVQLMQKQGSTVFDGRGDQLLIGGPQLRRPAAAPEQPAAVVNPTGQQVADGVQLKLDLEGQQVQEDPKRKAGDLLPWLLAAGGTGLAAYALAEELNRGNPGAQVPAPLV